MRARVRAYGAQHVFRVQSPPVEQPTVATELVASEMGGGGRCQCAEKGRVLVDISIEAPKKKGHKCLKPFWKSGG